MREIVKLSRNVQSFSHVTWPIFSKQQKRIATKGKIWQIFIEIFCIRFVDLNFNRKIQRKYFCSNLKMTNFRFLSLQNPISFD